MTIKREVYRTKRDNQDCIMITSPDGEIDAIYPIRVKKPKAPGYSYTMEVSTELLLNIAIMQNKGIKVIFKP